MRLRMFNSIELKKICNGCRLKPRTNKPVALLCVVLMPSAYPITSIAITRHLHGRGDPRLRHLTNPMLLVQFMPLRGSSIQLGMPERKRSYFICCLLPSPCHEKKDGSEEYKTCENCAADPDPSFCAVRKIIRLGIGRC